MCRLEANLVESILSSSTCMWGSGDWAQSGHRVCGRSTLSSHPAAPCVLVMFPRADHAAEEKMISKSFQGARPRTLRGRFFRNKRGRQWKAGILVHEEVGMQQWSPWASCHQCLCVVHPPPWEMSRAWVLTTASSWLRSLSAYSVKSVTYIPSFSPPNPLIFFIL